MFNNENEKINKNFIIKNNNVINNESNLDEIEKNEQNKINLVNINENVKKKMLNAQILYIENAKTCEHVLSKNRDKLCEF